MSGPPKILLLDDDQDFLDLYREMLSQHLSSLPDVRVASSGSRGLAMLESEPFNLLTVDLNMPNMDGLQVLSIARRKYPELRLVVLTAIREEQFRTRAYAMGVDQYWIKPESDQEVGLFMESIESLLNREASGGFRGVQSKSLVDIIQLECLSQSSTVLKITNGILEGKIWIQNGEVIDAEAPEATAEPAFGKILAWKTGSFENLPPVAGDGADVATSAQLLADLSQLNGVEFLLAVSANNREAQNFWGLENPKPMADWMHETMDNFRALGERLQVGQMQQVVGTGPQRKVALAPCGKSELCVGFPPSLSADQLRDTMKSILTKWAS